MGELIYRLTARQLLMLAVNLQRAVLIDWLETNGHPLPPGDRLLEYLTERGIEPERASPDEEANRA